MENSQSQSSTLHKYHVHKLHALFYIIHSLCQAISIVFIFYFRTTFFFDKSYFRDNNTVHFLPWLIILFAELIFSFLWLLKQPFYWRPVTRTVFPENLPKDDEDLPGIDVFICTADPKKEPTFEVMNTVISAMSLDYPATKLCVYLSDDAYASVTLSGMKEAWAFATWWLPFCRRHNIKTVCPKAYFEQPKEKSQSSEFIQERNMIQEKYEAFKLRVQSTSHISEIHGGSNTSVKDHPPLIQVINTNVKEDDSEIINTQDVPMPSLVYVSREKQASYPHHFKAGALNVLLRVSATMSHSPYILVLDCDMYCNDSISARQAMCFYQDPKMLPTLGWVQYPQTFHNVNKKDIYDSQMSNTWMVFWPGADGFQGPIISGTNFYINRKALYGFHLHNGNDIIEGRCFFGPSHELFTNYLTQTHMHYKIKRKELYSDFIQEANSLASCTYEDNTKWGEKVGFRYESVVEDAMTGYVLQSKGWRSVYLNPINRPQFLGSATTNLNELLIQNTRWASGLFEIGLSKYCPLFCTPSKMQILHKMLSSWVTLFPLYFIPVWCFLTIPTIGFFFGIPLYPKVSDPYFLAYAYVLTSSLLKNLYEVVTTRPRASISTISIVLNEERIWMIKSLTCHVYGFLDFLMTKLGLKEATFLPTNKSEDNGASKLYELGKYDFRTSNMFLVPLVTMVSLNLWCFVGGIARLNTTIAFDSMFAQVFISFYIFVVSFPIIEAMFVRQDVGCIPLLVTLKSTFYSVILLGCAYLFLLY